MIAPLRHEEEDYSKELDLALWRKLFAYTRPYRRSVIWICVAGVVTAFADTAYPLLTRAVIDDVKDHGVSARLVPYAVAWGAVTLVLAFCIWGFIWLAGKLRTHISHDIRRAGFEKLQQLSFSYYDRRPVGWLMARMTSDCERLSNILAWGVLDFAWGMTLLTCISAVMFWMDARLALAVLAVLPVLAWVSAFFRKRILRSARVVRKTNSRITASFNESIMGVRTSKVFVRHEENHREFRGVTGEMYHASVRNALHSALYLPVVLSLGTVATAVALTAGGFDVSAGRISIGTLVAFLWYTRHFFDPIQQLAHWFAEMPMAQASAERILGLIDTVPDIRDAPGIDDSDAPRRVGDIAFRDVSFAYKEGKPILEGFNLEVRPGETIALVGSTGGGKTTIVNLLSRFYEPAAGEIRLHGVDYRRRSLHWLQSKLGIVLQEPHLFRGSVAENLRYGRLDATDEEIAEAACLAGAHDFIVALEKGYETDVGEGGNRLSTGQKQLLSFARAILKRPQILVMDEATSSVDTETEQRIQAGLARVLEGRTSFVIAHRLSTIRAADRILVIEHGRIVEEGSHRELMAHRGRYHDLYTQQSLRESVRGDWAI
ncbi:MAG: ABC transporter ATP-binding protein [Planctomycetota bacterium]|jgi:ATP-binding cassette subfamily B protein